MTEGLSNARVNGYCGGQQRRCEGWSGERLARQVREDDILRGQQGVKKRASKAGIG